MRITPDQEEGMNRAAKLVLDAMFQIGVLEIDDEDGMMYIVNPHGRFLFPPDTLFNAREFLKNKHYVIRTDQDVRVFVQDAIKAALRILSEYNPTTPQVH